ncbi:MAG: hypothetical protein ACRCS8_02160 [Brevinema sp.]
MPCIKVEQVTNIAITMPQSSIIGTPIYHYHIVKVPLKIWNDLPPKLQQLYTSKVLSLLNVTYKVSSVLLFVTPNNNRFDVIKTRVALSDNEKSLIDDVNSYEEQVLIDVFTKYCAKNYNKIQWSLKNVCI